MENKEKNNLSSKKIDNELNEDITLSAKFEFFKKFWFGVLLIIYCVSLRYFGEIEDLYKGAIDTNIRLLACVFLFYLIGLGIKYLENIIEDDEELSETFEELKLQKSKNSNSKSHGIAIFVSSLCVLCLSSNFARIEFFLWIIYFVVLRIKEKLSKKEIENHYKYIFFAYLISIVSMISYLKIINPITIDTAEVILNDNFKGEWYILGITQDENLPENELGYYHFVPKDRENDFMVAISVESGELHKIKIGN